MEAARFVVSDAVAALWGRMLARYGAAVLAEGAMPQLARWESRFGWTRTGFGAVSERETSLASVLARLLPDPDAWVACADEYLKALDRLAQTEPARAKRVYGYNSTGYERKRRAGDLAEWHGMLLERLADYDAMDRLTPAERTCCRTLLALIMAGHDVARSRRARRTDRAASAETCGDPRCASAEDLSTVGARRLCGAGNAKGVAWKPS
jgi:hypothetical protein